MPGKSILKPSSQDDTGDHTGNHDTLDDTAAGIAGGLTPDVTESFSSTFDFTKRSRKSISRRVSFAATARIRMFERDDKEDELPKTTSFVEGLNAREILRAPFTFESGNRDNTNETIDSTSSIGARSDSSHGENSIVSAESSDSDKDRSFEVNVYSSHTDSAESTGSRIGLFVSSSESDHNNIPFYGGNIDHTNNDEDDSHFIPDLELIKQSSGLGAESDDHILGHQIGLDLQTSGDHLASGISNPDDDTQDFSMEYRFRSHRSSLPERLSVPPLPQHHHQNPQVLTGLDLDSHQPSTSEVDSMSMSDVTLDLTGSKLTALLGVGGSLSLLSQEDILNEQLDLVMDMDLTGDFSKADRSIVDDDTDMDITAPIGGIHDLGQAQDLANELPPTAFHSVLGDQQQATQSTDHDEGRDDMDLTAPIGGIHDLESAQGTNEQPPTVLHNTQEEEQQETPTLDDEGEDDSYVELPPVTLSKFLSLVGISFLDQLNASTRRRTIPHQPNAADGSAATYRIEDLVKAVAVSTPVLNSYREACQLLKQSMDQSRAFIDGEEKKVSKTNPEYFREFRESDVDTKEFMKDRFRMIKVHSKLEANVKFNGWKTDLLKVQQMSLEQHLVELNNDIRSLTAIKSALSEESTKVVSRRQELKRLVEEAIERQRSYALCDKEQLASLAEAAEEQGGQIENYESIKAEKAKELAELRARVQKLRLTEQGNKTRITAAEKTIQDHQYVRTDDLNRAQDVLSIIQATHRWEPLRAASSPPSPAALVLQTGKPLEFVYDKTLKVVIDITRVGKAQDAVQVTEFEEEEVGESTMGLEPFSTSWRRLSISALAPRKRKDIKEYGSLLRDYTGMVASKYKPGTAIGKILSDISQFWSKICLISREIELVRAQHMVDLVAGSAENLKELENSNGTKQVAGSTPLVVLDIRVRFTGKILGSQKNADHLENGTEPVKFYLWFTFTLNDLLTFPRPNSFTWRLETVYGNMSRDHVARSIGPVTKKGGYDVLREICLKVNQLIQA